MSTDRFQKEMEEFPWSCEFCEKKFRIRPSLLDHVRNKHKGLKLTPTLLPRKVRHTCHLCGQDFRFKDSLHRHLNDEHQANLKRTLRCLGKSVVSQRKEKVSSRKRVQDKSNQNESWMNTETCDEDPQSPQETKCSLCLGQVSSKENRDDGNFENHLSVFHLVYSLLEIPSEMIESYLFKYGNPMNWMVLCNSCNDISKEAERISKRIVALKYELKQLKFKILVPLSIKLELGEDGRVLEDIGGAAVEIREYIQSIRAPEMEDNLDEFVIVGMGQEEDTMPEDEEPINEACDFTFSPLTFSHNNDVWDSPEEVEEYCGAIEADEPEKKLSISPVANCKRGIELTGSELAKQYRVRNLWKCPVCPKGYKKQRVWRNHISRLHKPFVLHLQNEVPSNHVCQAGNCLPNKSPADGSKQIKYFRTERTRKQNLREFKDTVDVKSESEQWSDNEEGKTATQPERRGNVGSGEPNDTDTSWKWDTRPRRSVTLKKKINYSTMADSSEVEAPVAEQDSDWSSTDGDDEVEDDPNFEDRGRRRHSLLSRNSKDVGSERLWQCTICSNVFGVLNSTQDHVRKKHLIEMEKSGLKTRAFCKYLGDPEDLKSEKNEESDSRKLWQCTVCSHRYLYFTSAQDHVRKKHSIELDKTNLKTKAFCKYLGNQEDSNITKRNPGSTYVKKRKHEESDMEKLWQCTICSSKYILEKTAQDHVRKKHSTEVEKSNLPTRMFCKYTGDPTDIRKTQISRVKQDWKCTVCGAKFSSQTSAKNHCDAEHEDEIERAKSEGKNFLLYEFVGDTAKSSATTWECQLCDERFFSQVALLHHCRIRHDKESKESKTHLMQNSEIVGGYVIHYSSENALYKLPYKCYSCPKSYFTLKVLTDHIRKTHRRQAYLPEIGTDNPTETPDNNSAACDAVNSSSNIPISESSTVLVTNYSTSAVVNKTQVSNQKNEVDLKAKSLIHRATKFLRKNADKTEHNLTNAAKESETLNTTDDVEEGEHSNEKIDDNIKSNLFYRQPSDSPYKYQCLSCDLETPQSFKLFESLQQHCHTKHNLSVSLKTGPCTEWALVEDEVLKSQLLLMKSRNHDNDSNIPYSCKICGYKLSDVRRLPLHMRAVHGIIVSVRRPRPRTYKGRKLPEVKEKRDWLSVVEEYRKSRSGGYVTTAKMKQDDGILHMRQSNLHYLSQKYDVTEFPCGRCDQTFDNFHNWNEHDRADHFMGFKCDQCGQGLAARQNLENHIRTMHLRTELAVCKGCKIPYKKQENFIKHIRYDAMEDCKAAAFPCAEKTCKRRSYCFTSQEFLDVHTKVYHEQVAAKPFKCSKCPKSFNFKIKWIEHENVHLGKEECICEHCGKTFQAQARLRIHIRSQHGETLEFPCNICKRVFPTRAGLVRHQKLHLADNPYMCSTCGKTFKLQNYLTIHMWSHDPDRHKKYSLYKPRPKTKSSSSSKIGKRSKPRVSIILPPGETLETCDSQILSGRRPKRPRRKKDTSESEADSSSQDISTRDTDEDSQESQETSSTTDVPSSSTNQPQSFHDMPNIADAETANRTSRDLSTVNLSNLW